MQTVDKYIRPTSVSWWAGFIPLCSGVFLSTEVLHELSSLAIVVKEVTGYVSPAVLINSGLAIIGLRAAQN